jgi:hypothetical protein
VNLIFHRKRFFHPFREAKDVAAHAVREQHRAAAPASEKHIKTRAPYRIPATAAQDGDRDSCPAQ